MRCFNCGWDNNSSSSICVKCGQVLVNNSRDENDGLSASSPADNMLKSKETAVFPAGGVLGNRITSIQQITKCPSCSYPVAGNFENCPNCGTLLKKVLRATTEVKRQQESISLEDEKMNCQECGQEVLMSSTYCPHCGKRLHKPTIRRQVKHTIETEQISRPKCSLEIIPEEGECVDIEKKEYEGQSIILNRENTDIDNRSITSKEQAELTFEDGYWYLIDKSELQTTYIQATRKIELQAEDIIVLGDRRFKFNCHEQSSDKQV